MSGRYLFQPAADSLKVNASTAVTTTVTPEGPAATLGDEGVAGRERGFTFPGTAGSFVYPEPALPSFRSGDSAGSGSLVGPDGATVPDWSFNQGWLLPSDGTYTLRVTPSLAATWAGTPVTMRVRQAVSLPTMAYDVPTRFTVEQPDRWIVARVDVPNGQYSHRFHVLRPDLDRGVGGDRRLVDDELLRARPRAERLW